MARNRNRNRKRARDRRPRRPQDSALATANGQPSHEAEEAPEPLEHATPDAELAEAQLALGRPELSEVPDEQELDELATSAGTGSSRRAARATVDEVDEAAAITPPAHKEPIFTRLVHFLRGSWHELQRVQWPDRRQVFQATGVVLGFVIVAGVFLGVADVVAQKVVNLILYGHT